ncbi:ribosomal 40S subunit protein S10A [Balamuthia mandrillaris]
MLVPKKSRIAVYSYLFKEGVLVAKKDHTMTKHPDVDVPNLWVCKLMQSMVSRGYCREQFAWRCYYWFLTNEGIQYLRDFLHLPAEIVPATLKKPRTQPRAALPARRPAPGGERRAFGADEKKVGPGRDFQPSFGARPGGFGRGRPAGAAPGGRDSYRREGGRPSFGRGGPARE